MRHESDLQLVFVIPINLMEFSVLSRSAAYFNRYPPPCPWKRAEINIIYQYFMFRASSEVV